MYVVNFLRIRFYSQFIDEESKRSTVLVVEYLRSVARMAPLGNTALCLTY